MIKSTFEQANSIDPTGISGMVASFIHDECISRADINNPLLNNHKKKFTLKNISFP